MRAKTRTRVGGCSGDRDSYGDGDRVVYPLPPRNSKASARLQTICCIVNNIVLHSWSEWLEVEETLVSCSLLEKLR